MQTLVIGAGTAELAARAAEGLEARERTGGRDFTDRTFSYTPVMSGTVFVQVDYAPT